MVIILRKTPSLVLKYKLTLSIMIQLLIYIYTVYLDRKEAPIFTITSSKKRYLNLMYPKRGYISVISVRNGSCYPSSATIVLLILSRGRLCTAKPSGIATPLSTLPTVPSACGILIGRPKNGCNTGHEMAI
jgi:hypothetical protein